MRSRLVATATLMMLTSVAAVSWWGDLTVAQTQPAHDIPQSFKVAHQETLAELTGIGKRRTHTGQIARQAIAAVKGHFRREEEYILPPLTLAPAIALGHVTPDMKWAIAMADRIKADRETIFVEHTVITQWMNELAAAGVGRLLFCRRRGGGSPKRQRSEGADGNRDRRLRAREASGRAMKSRGV